MNYDWIGQVGRANFLLGIVAVSHTLNRLNNGGIFWIDFDSFSKLGDVLVQGAAVRHVIKSPALVEESVARDRLAFVLMQQRKDFDLTQAQIECVLSSFGSQFGGINDQVV